MKNLWLTIFVLTIATSSFAQSVVDVARKERERQRTAKSSVVVVSNVPTPNAETTPASTPDASATPAAPGTSATATAGASTPAAASTGIKDNKGRDEKYWRDTFQKARDDVKRAEAKIEILDVKVKDLNTQLLRQSDVYNRENRLGTQISAAQKEIDDARLEVEAARKKVLDLEDELRRSAGPPGWAR